MAPRRVGLLAVAATCAVASAGGVAAGCGGGHGDRTSPRPVSGASDVALKRDARATPGTARPATLALRGAARRAGVLRDAERAITRDARARVRRGVLDGHISGTRCARSQGTADVYSCVALTIPLHPRPGALIGHPYSARVDVARGRFAFCYAQPVAGEGATPELGKVRPLPRACGGTG